MATIKAKPPANVLIGNIFGESPYPNWFNVRSQHSDLEQIGDRTQ